MEDILRMEHITKCFGEVFANKDVNLNVHQGEVHTLLGENGAGKSTLMSILAGLYQPTYGKIWYKGKEVKLDSPKTAVNMGIGMVYQHFMLIENMTVLDNIILGTSAGHSPVINRKMLRKTITELAEKYGLELEFDQKIKNISVGAQQRVEILKALYRNADLLILDEPTAALTDSEVDSLFDIIRRLVKENKSVIFISHKMKEVMTISDRITVLRDGRTVKTLKRSETTGTFLADLMTGREVKESVYEKHTDMKENAFEIRNVSYQPNVRHGGLNNISLAVRKGEILGVAGVDGNGQSQLAQIATGNLRPESGELLLNNKPVNKFTSKYFISNHVAHIPEDRNKMGLIGEMNVAENIILKETETPEFSIGRGLFLRKKRIMEYASRIRNKNDIRCASLEQEVRRLSGGNQQKIILGRELAEDPRMLVAVNPTRGLDIGASEYVHDAMISARDRGCGILLISADLDEILKLSDRIIVLFEGKIMGIFPGDNAPVKEISRAMTGRQSEEAEL